MGRASRKTRIRRVWREIEPRLRSQLIVLLENNFDPEDFRIFAEQLAELKHLSLEDHIQLSSHIEDLMEEVAAMVPHYEDEPLQFQVNEIMICDHCKDELESMDETAKLRKIGEYIKEM